MILLVLITLLSTATLIFTIFVIETNDNDVVEQKVHGSHYLSKVATAVIVLENGGDESNLYALNTYRVQHSLSHKPLFLPNVMSEDDFARTETLRGEVGVKHKEAYFRQLKPMDDRFYKVLVYLKDQLLGRTLEDHMEVPENILLQLQVKLYDGRWLHMNVYDKTAFPVWISSTLAPTAIFAIVFIVFAVLVVRHITRPLAELAYKADELGKGHTIKAIEPHGPEDVQHAIIAFNSMHKRILSVNDHRAKALAAISHDIRTPLTSMRLNAEYIGEPDVQQTILDKIDEMEQICEATVTFALKDSWSEKDKKFDLISLVESLCCDLNEQELDVTFDAKGKLPFLGRPVALKRALNNLIRNGVEYGNKVEVFVIPNEKEIEIHIKDQGDGIKNEDKERLFEPFERTEESRNRNSGGIGLGMAIARSVVRSHGGEIELVNLPEKGLDAVVILPT